MRFLAAVMGCLVLSGCVESAKSHLASDRDDDKTCRSFMKNKHSGDDTTYEECRRSLLDIANTPALGLPAPSNVTVIVNQ